MKIRVIDRIILFLLALVLLVTGVCAALNEFANIDVWAKVQPMLPITITDLRIQIARIALIVVMVLVSLYLFRVSFRRKKKPDPFISMDSGSKGKIRMSIESISELVEKTCRDIPGVTELHVSTVNHEDSVSVELSFSVEMNRNIPELSAEIQQMVGEVVEKNCGVAVRNVCVTVSGFTVPVAVQPALPQAEKAERKGWFRLGRKDKEEKAEAPVVVSDPEVTMPEEQPTEPVFEEEAPVATEFVEPTETAEEEKPEAVMTWEAAPEVEEMPEEQTEE